jgi:hypothetical protein
MPSVKTLGYFLGSALPALSDSRMGAFACCFRRLAEKQLVFGGAEREARKSRFVAAISDRRIMDSEELAPPRKSEVRQSASFAKATASRGDCRYRFPATAAAVSPAGLFLRRSGWRFPFIGRSDANLFQERLD